jgi:amidophosphoribosyltransferase
MYLREKPYGDSFNEECGVFGIYSNEKRNVAYTVFLGLFALQHRGQESAGIAVAHENNISYYRGMGLVPEVFSGDALDNLPEGDIAIGHVRYSTCGPSLRKNAQPLVFTGKSGQMAVAHNGNLVNAKSLKEKLISQNAVFQTGLDSEVIANLINTYMSGSSDIVEAIIKAGEELCGSYTLTVMTPNKLIAVRDPYGMRPLCLGKIGDEYVVASESCALDAVGAGFIRDIEPGEILEIDYTGLKSHYFKKRGSCLCIFEHVYFARPDSIIDGVSVYNARKEAGKILAEKFPADADIVSGVPDSAIIAARGFAEHSGIPYVEALNKNRYVGRTFIQPEQRIRELGVSIKMNVLKTNIYGKRIVLIDDSIVRGTTSKKIIALLKNNGAKEVHMRICSPIIKHPCYFGIDTQTYSQLIASEYDKAQVCKYIGADSLEYLDVNDLTATTKGSKQGFCLGCFTGKYPFKINRKDADQNRFEIK